MASQVHFPNEHARRKKAGALNSLGSNSRVDLLSILVESDSWWGSSDSSSSSGSYTDNLGVDCARDAVVELVVKLWESILGVDRGIGDISDGSRLDHVSYGESLDGLVLRDTSRAVRASDRFYFMSDIVTRYYDPS